MRPPRPTWPGFPLELPLKLNFHKAGGIHLAEKDGCGVGEELRISFQQSRMEEILNLAQGQVAEYQRKMIEMGDCKIWVFEVGRDPQLDQLARMHPHCMHTHC
jgi:hypothetical protein